MNNVLFSKKSDQWATPKELYNFIISKGFVDPCPLSLNYIVFQNFNSNFLEVVDRDILIEKLGGVIDDLY